MKNKPKAGAVIFVKDIEKISLFYKQILMLSVTYSDLSKVVLETDAFLLTLHLIPAPIAESITIIEPPRPRDNIAIKLFFPVNSIAETRALATSLGGSINPSSDEWNTSNFTACDGFDPEGNVFQIRALVS